MNEKESLVSSCSDLNCLNVRKGDISDVNNAATLTANLGHTTTHAAHDPTMRHGLLFANGRAHDKAGQDCHKLEPFRTLRQGCLKVPGSFLSQSLTLDV